MRPGFGAYLALNRIVLIPDMSDKAGRRLTDTDRLISCPADTADQQLGTAALGLLVGQRQLNYTMDFRSERYRRWLSARRRRICAAFGVKAMKGWLPEATHVRCSTTDNELAINPWRHAGKQDTWSGHAADPVETVPLSDSQQVGSALRRMLTLRLPPEC